MKKSRPADERSAWASLLRKLADCIEEASAADVEDLVSGRASLHIRSRASRDSRPAPAQVREQPATEWKTVVERLRSLESRDEGERLLTEVAGTKALLEGLARYMDLPVVRQDTVEHLRRKIVESTIGSLLRSRAIRGTTANESKSQTRSSMTSADADAARRERVLREGRVFWQECEILRQESPAQDETRWYLRCPLCGQGEIVRWKDATPGYKDSSMVPCTVCGLSGDGSYLDVRTAASRFRSS